MSSCNLSLVALCFSRLSADSMTHNSPLRLRTATSSSASPDLARSTLLCSPYANWDVCIVFKLSLA